MNLIQSEVIEMEFLSDVYHRKLVETYNEIQDTYKKMGGIVSTLDRKVNSLYHELEATTEETLDPIAFTTELKGVLLRRRALKDEMARLRPFIGFGRYTVNELELRYEGAQRVSGEIRQQLNCTMTAEQVCAEMGVEIG
jgi:hypothetical protein